jgi:hypothetical protein
LEESAQYIDVQNEKEEEEKVLSEVSIHALQVAGRRVGLSS